MLPKTQRVGKELFPKIFSGGRSFSSPHLSVRVLPPASDGGVGINKFSFTVSKTVSKKAVQRNLLRRRGYSAIKKTVKETSPGFVCVFSFKKGSENLSYSEISEEIRFLLEKSGILKIKK